MQERFHAGNAGDGQVGLEAPHQGASIVALGRVQVVVAHPLITQLVPLLQDELLHLGDVLRMTGCVHGEVAGILVVSRDRADAVDQPRLLPQPLVEASTASHT